MDHHALFSFRNRTNCFKKASTSAIMFLLSTFPLGSKSAPSFFISRAFPISFTLQYSQIRLKCYWVLCPPDRLLTINADGFSLMGGGTYTLEVNEIQSQAFFSTAETLELCSGLAKITPFAFPTFDLTSLTYSGNPLSMTGSILKRGKPLTSRTSIYTSGLLMSRQARIRPELEEDLESEPEMATILYTISCLMCNNYNSLGIDYNKQVQRQIFTMASHQQHPMRQSNATAINKKRPLSFRVIMKSKSGFLGNNVDDVKDNVSTSQKMNKTQSSFKKEDIKDYVKSMRNKTTLQFNKRRTEDESRSNRSYQRQQKSLALSRALSLNDILSERQQSSQLSVEQLERRIDQLIAIKLSANSPSSHQKHDPSSIDREISELVSKLRVEATGDGSEQKLQVINRKIGILEKVMAESMTQSELAKKSYYKYLNNRKPTKPRFNTSHMDSILLKQKATALSHNITPTSLHYESTNQLDYKAPDKKSYPTKQQKTSYQFRNQPMHRSSYDRDFLVYVNVPDLPFREGPSQILPSYSVGKRNSSYQNEFTNKKVERINFKQLDCYRDKFKDIEIPFMQKARRIVDDVKLVDPERAAVGKVGKTKRYKTEHYVKNLSTESRVNFTGETNQIKSFIKHKNLTDLKYAFKASAHA